MQAVPRSGITWSSLTPSSISDRPHWRILVMLSPNRAARLACGRWRARGRLPFPRHTGPPVALGPSLVHGAARVDRPPLGPCADLWALTDLGPGSASSAAPARAAHDAKHLHVEQHRIALDVRQVDVCAVDDALPRSGTASPPPYWRIPVCAAAAKHARPGRCEISPTPRSRRRTGHGAPRSGLDHRDHRKRRELRARRRGRGVGVPRRPSRPRAPGRPPAAVWGAVVTCWVHRSREWLRSRQTCPDFTPPCWREVPPPLTSSSRDASARVSTNARESGCRRRIKRTLGVWAPARVPPAHRD
jgi:hypothetical protein